MRFVVPIVTVVIFFVGLWSPVHGDDAQDVRTAVFELYDALNNGDADAFVGHMWPGGYTEFGGSGGLIETLDKAYIRGALEAGVKTDLGVQHLDVRVHGDSAIVTGYRVGSITMPNGTASDDTLCLSMMWFRENGKWKLAHVHLSPLRPND